MTNLNFENCIVGRANAVLVFPMGEDSKAIVTPVIARTINRGGGNIYFSGPGPFSVKTQKHIIEIVFPAVKQILTRLRIPQTDFEICISNIDVASVNDIVISVAGFSADLAIFLALLSAGLHLPIPVNAVFTGHIASKDGDVRSVKGIPTKLKAVMDIDSLNLFFHPPVSSDHSLDILSPHEKETIEGALAEAKRTIQTIAVKNLAHLVEQVFIDEYIVLSSLNYGYYNFKTGKSNTNTGVEKIVAFLTNYNTKRFWTILEHQFIENRSDDARNLLTAFIHFYITQKKYPSQFGKKLWLLLLSLPSFIRKKLITPIIPTPDCVKVSHFADSHQHEDILFLFKAVTGEKRKERPQTGNKQQLDRVSEKEHSNPLLDNLISDLSIDELTRLIGLPIDSARAVFQLETVVVDSK